jgi:diketogulonate reductase-like aldo/keto reductase
LRLTGDPWIYPIPGAKRPEQAAESAGTVEWMLSDDDWRRLDRLGWEISRKITYVTW